MTQPIAPPPPTLSQLLIENTDRSKKKKKQKFTSIATLCKRYQDNILSKIPTLDLHERQEFLSSKKAADATVTLLRRIDNLANHMLPERDYPEAMPQRGETLLRAYQFREGGEQVFPQPTNLTRAITTTAKELINTFEGTCSLIASGEKNLGRELKQLDRLQDLYHRRVKRWIAEDGEQRIGTLAKTFLALEEQRWRGTADPSAIPKGPQKAQQALAQQMRLLNQPELMRSVHERAAAIREQTTGVKPLYLATAREKLLHSILTSPLYQRQDPSDPSIAEEWFQELEEQILTTKPDMRQALHICQEIRDILIQLTQGNPNHADSLLKRYPNDLLEKGVTHEGIMNPGLFRDMIVTFAKEIGLLENIDPGNSPLQVELGRLVFRARKKIGKRAESDPSALKTEAYRLAQRTRAACAKGKKSSNPSQFADRTDRWIWREIEAFIDKSPREDSIEEWVKHHSLQLRRTGFMPKEVPEVLRYIYKKVSHLSIDQAKQEIERLKSGLHFDDKTVIPELQAAFQQQLAEGTSSLNITTDWLQAALKNTEASGIKKKQRLSKKAAEHLLTHGFVEMIRDPHGLDVHVLPETFGLARGNLSSLQKKFHLLTWKAVTIRRFKTLLKRHHIKLTSSELHNLHIDLHEKMKEARTVKEAAQVALDALESEHSKIVTPQQRQQMEADLLTLLDPRSTSYQHAERILTSRWKKALYDNPSALPSSLTLLQEEFQTLIAQGNSLLRVHLQIHAARYQKLVRQLQIEAALDLLRTDVKITASLLPDFLKDQAVQLKKLHEATFRIAYITSVLSAIQATCGCDPLGNHTIADGEFHAVIKRHNLDTLVFKSRASMPRLTSLLTRIVRRMKISPTEKQEILAKIPKEGEPMTSEFHDLRDQVVRIIKSALQNKGTMPNGVNETLLGQYSTQLKEVGDEFMKLVPSYRGAAFQEDASGGPKITGCK